jgi:hypothetical protein
MQIIKKCVCLLGLRSYVDKRTGYVYGWFSVLPLEVY